MGKKKRENVKKMSAAELHLIKKKEWISKFCCFGAGAFFSVFILIVFTDYTNITAVKYNSFWVMTVILALIYAFEKGGLLLESQVRVKADTLNTFPFIFVGGYLFFNVLSVIFSPFSGEVNGKGQSLLIFGDTRYDGLLVIFLYIILFLIFSFEKSFGKWFSYIVTGTLAIMTLVGMIQLFGVNFFGFYPSFNFYFYGKFISTSGNVDMVSAVYCLILPMVAFSYIAEEQKVFLKILRITVIALSVFMFWEINVDSGKLAFIIMLFAAFNILFFKRSWYLKFFNVLIVSFVAMMLSRVVEFNYDNAEQKLSFSFDWGGAYIYAVFIAASVMISLIYRYLINESRLKTSFIILAVLEVLGLAAALWWILAFAEPSHGTIYEFAEILKGRGRNGYGSARYGLWKYTKEIADERPLLGYGTGTFRRNLAEFTEGITRRYSTGKFDFAHNEFLQIYYNCGIFGLVSYVGLVGSLLVRGVKNALKNSKVLILTFALICFIIQSFFMFSIVIVSPLFWVTAGMLCYELRNIKSLKEK